MMSHLNSTDVYTSICPFFPLVLISIEKIYQTLEIVFQHISKQLEVRQKYVYSYFRTLFLVF